MPPKTASPYSLDEIADLKADHRSLDLIDEAPGEFLPLEATERLAAGDSAVKVWRQHRGMNQGELAAASGISQNYLSEIERGRKGGSVEVLKALAQALGLDLDDLA